MRIAIVGSGVSGLVAAHHLHGRHEIEVFEAAPWIGGHTHTVDVEVSGRSFAVDTGFIVYNRRNYPLFTELLAELSVETLPSDMSFGVRCDRTGLEYATRSADALLARRTNLLRPSFHRMLRDLLRFQREGRRLLAEPDEKVTLGEFALGRGYSEDFIERYLIPMGAAIWSAQPERMRDFPACSLLRFFENHGLLQRSGQPRWRVVRGGSRSYVEALVAPFRDRVHVRTPVRKVRRHAGGVELRIGSGDVARFDQVVMATHSDQALALLADPSDAERRVLGAIRYQPNEVSLHTDTSVLPRRRRAWASWNYRIPADRREQVVVTYHMNRLQSLDAPVDLCVTLNDARSIDPRHLLGRWTYEHPVFDGAAIAAQRERHRISGVNRTHYCGAWWGHGFHEDGVRSGVDAARAITASGVAEVEAARAIPATDVVEVEAA